MYGGIDYSRSYDIRAVLFCLPSHMLDAYERGAIYYGSCDIVGAIKQTSCAVHAALKWDKLSPCAIEAYVGQPPLVLSVVVN